MSEIASLKVLLAYGETDARSALQTVLTQLGSSNVLICDSGRMLIAEALRFQPDLIITGIDLPELDGVSALLQISEHLRVPAIIITQQAALEQVERALDDHVMAYLLEPLRIDDLLPTVHLVLRRFREFQELHTEVTTLRQALDDRKVIERAKGQLMKQADLDEDAAYKRLRRVATDNRIRLVEAAEWVLDVDQQIAPVDQQAVPQNDNPVPHEGGG